MKKLTLNDIKSGSLVSEIRNTSVEFLHNGEKLSIDIRVKQLPFRLTEPLYTRLNKGEDVVAEWLSHALMDDDGNQQFTPKQIEDNFTQALVSAIFNVVIGLDDLKKQAEGKEKKPAK